MPIPYRFFVPADAARMSKLQFIAREVVEGIITGLHKSPHRGFSVEFSEHREYVAGDELRHMDWRAYARSDRYYVKVFEQETNLRAMLVLDTSASMSFGNKLDYAKRLAACLAYLLSIQQDLAGLVAVDESVRVELPPGSSATHLDRLFREMERIAPANRTDLARQVHALAERLPRRSLVILLSDLWLEPQELYRSLQHLRFRRHHGMVIHLLDRTEIDLPYDRRTTFEDLETGERIQVDPRDVRDTYRAQVRDYLKKVRRACNDCDVEYHTVDIREPYDRALVRLIAARA